MTKMNKYTHIIILIATFISFEISAQVFNKNYLYDNTNHSINQLYESQKGYHTLGYFEKGGRFSIGVGIQTINKKTGNITAFAFTDMIGVWMFMCKSLKPIPLDSNTILFATLGDKVGFEGRPNCIYTFEYNTDKNTIKIRDSITRNNDPYLWLSDIYVDHDTTVFLTHGKPDFLTYYNAYSIYVKNQQPKEYFLYNDSLSPYDYTFKKIHRLTDGKHVVFGNKGVRGSVNSWMVIRELNEKDLKSKNSRNTK